MWLRALGDGFPIGYQLMADELLDDGFSLEEAMNLVNEVHLIGDAKVPRNIHDAMHEGYQTGLNI